jgi:hypothetical protein
MDVKLHALFSSALDENEIRFTIWPHAPQGDIHRYSPDTGINRPQSHCRCDEKKRMLFQTMYFPQG